MPQQDDQDRPPGALPERRVEHLAVLQYQVGAMQESLNRGIGGLERTMERGFETLGGRLEKVETQINTIQERQAFDAARLKALEQFREELDRREQDRAKKQEADLALAVDGTQQAKTMRLLAQVFVASLGVIGTVVAIIVALTGGFG